MVYPLLLSLHVLICVLLVLLVLLQHGKGAEMGAAFGSGASATLFGARGSGNFLTRSTAILAMLFFISNLALGYIIFKEVRPTQLIADEVLPEIPQEDKKEDNTGAPTPVEAIPSSAIPEEAIPADASKEGKQGTHSSTANTKKGEPSKKP